jgi:hypothetical protein
LRRVGWEFVGQPDRSFHSWPPRVDLSLSQFILDHPLFIYVDFLPLLVESRGDTKRCKFNLLIAFWSTAHKSASANDYSAVAKPGNVAKLSHITFLMFIPSALSKHDHDPGIWEDSLFSGKKE